MSDVPLADHALLSDCRSAALVTRAGSVDWFCLPRFDSSPVLARLLDNSAGHFLIAPMDVRTAARWTYRRSTLVLDTVWPCADGELVVTDALALGRRERGHDLGHSAPGVLLRRARCTRGTVRVRAEFAPRPEFGLIHPRLTAEPGSLLADGGAHQLRLSTDVALDVEDACAVGTWVMTEGQELTFAVHRQDPWGPPTKPWTSRKIQRRLEETEAAWVSWSRLHQRYEGPMRDLVHHSGVVLQGLTYARSGAILAAATTSLPEGVGSGRTWDYRFTWVRDASMTMQGLYVAACPDEAERFFTFLARCAATQLDRRAPLQIMFGIEGERDLTERELPHLAGWRDSSPVRAGNGAWQQSQLDVYGALLDAAFTLREHLGDASAGTRTFLVAAVDAAAERWEEDDQGLWEMRGPARPFLHSKLMCWVALDRGIALAEAGLISDARLTKWRRLRAEIRDAIETRGWHPGVAAFTQAFDSDDLDAAGLLVAVVGFLPPSDPRLRSTIDAIEADLSDERGLIHRYRVDDGFEGAEGSFLLCTFWLAHALALTGQLERAREVLTRASRCATDLGLFAEQVDPATGELLGNFPQAFSHLGLVNAAAALAAAEEEAAQAS